VKPNLLTARAQTSLVSAACALYYIEARVGLTETAL
jgi:hypothetical protein